MAQGSDTPETKRSTWQWTAKREQAALAFADGQSWRDIAASLGVSVSTLSEWKKAPEFVARIDEHHDAIVSDARLYLKRNAMSAAKKMVQLMEYGNAMHGVKLKAAQDILDRVGLKGVEKHEHKIDVTKLSDDELRAIAEN